jgi:hypothetical protein
LNLVSANQVERIGKREHYHDQKDSKEENVNQRLANGLNDGRHLLVHLEEVEKFQPYENGCKGTDSSHILNL